jgi:hypothetical protein
MGLQQFRLEGKQAQHVVHAGRHLLRAPATPGPDGRADEVDGLDARGLQLRFQPQVEIGCIHADEGPWRIGQQAAGQGTADTRDLSVVAQHLDIAAHGQLLVRPPGPKAVCGHARTTDPVGLQPRPALSQPAQQQPGQQVA